MAKKRTVQRNQERACSRVPTNNQSTWAIVHKRRVPCHIIKFSKPKKDSKPGTSSLRSSFDSDRADKISKTQLKSAAIRYARRKAKGKNALFHSTALRNMVPVHVGISHFEAFVSAHSVFFHPRCLLSPSQLGFALVTIVLLNHTPWWALLFF